MSEFENSNSSTTAIGHCHLAQPTTTDSFLAYAARNYRQLPRICGPQPIDFTPAQSATYRFRAGASREGFVALARETRDVIALVRGGVVGLADAAVFTRRPVANVPQLASDQNEETNWLNHFFPCCRSSRCK